MQNLLQLRGLTLNILASLKVTSGPTLNEEIPVKNRMTIGRRPTCDIQLASEIVTGVHCVIEKRTFGVLLEDLGSKNGTFLNDEPIGGKVELCDQDAFRVGDTVFTVRIYAAFATNSEEGSQAPQGLGSRRSEQESAPRLALHPYRRRHQSGR